MANRYVYGFDEPTTGGRELLGGKGIGLAEMTQMGVPVPQGFTITTDACRAYMQERDSPDGLADQVHEHVRRLVERTGTRFGVDVYPTLLAGVAGVAMRTALHRWHATDFTASLPALLDEAWDALRAGLPAPK